jgi:hypothetical protein
MSCSMSSCLAFRLWAQSPQIRSFEDDSPQSSHHSSGLSSTQTLAVAWRAKIPWIRSSGIHSWVISLSGNW